MEFIDTNTAAVRFGGAFQYWPYSDPMPEELLAPMYFLDQAPPYVKGKTHDYRWVEEVAPALAAWLPSDKDRMLWIQSASGSALFSELLLNWREARGATAALQQVPGHFFEAVGTAPVDWQASETNESLRDLASLIALTILAGWHGWFISAQCLDRIEFYDGGVRLYSPDVSRRDDAGFLLASFGWDVS